MLICCTVFFLSGCWDYTEFENIALVSVIGIDENKDSRKVTVTTVVPSIGKTTEKNTEKKGNSTPEDMVQAATDDTISDAMSKIQQVVGKRLFFGYLDILIIGKDAAENITGDIMEFLDRSPHIRATTFIAITDGEAKTLVSTLNNNALLPLGRNLKSIIKEGVYTGTAYPASIHDFLDALVVDGMEATAPQIENIITGQAEKADDDQNSGESGKILEPVDGYQRVSGMAIFKEAKLKGFLDVQASHGLGYINGKEIRDYKMIYCSEEHDIKSTLVFRITGSKKKITANLNNGKPEITVNIIATADLAKYLVEEGPEYLTNDVLNDLECKLAEGIRQDIELAIKKCQKDFGSDVFGFGYKIFRKYPKEWRTNFKDKWTDIFPDIPVYINVQAKITNTGTNIKKLEIS